MKKKTRVFSPKLLRAVLLMAFVSFAACATPMHRSEAEKAAAELTRAKEQELVGQRSQVRGELLARQAGAPYAQGPSEPYWQSRRVLPDAADRPVPPPLPEVVAAPVPDTIIEPAAPANMEQTAELAQAPALPEPMPPAPEMPASPEQETADEPAAPADDTIAMAALPVIGSIGTIPVQPPPPESVADPDAAPVAVPDDAPDDALPEQKTYDAALQMYFSRHYADAHAALLRLEEMYPDSPLRANIRYWQGECLFALKEYTQADLCFADVETLSPASPKLADALLMMVQCRLKLDQRAKAADTLKHLREKYPKSRQLRIAQNRMEESR